MGGMYPVIREGRNSCELEATKCVYEDLTLGNFSIVYLSFINST